VHEVLQFCRQESERLDKPGNEDPGGRFIQNFCISKSGQIGS